MRPEEARDEDRDEDDQDLEPIRAKERDDLAGRLAAPLLGDGDEIAGRAAAERATHAAAAAPSATTTGAARCGSTRRGPGAPARERHQAVAVAASVIPWASSQRSASMAALQPSAAAVTACR